MARHHALTSRRRFLSAGLIGLTAKADRAIAGVVRQRVSQRWAIGCAIARRFRSRARQVKIPLVIVGGGMAGLSAAWRLDKSGFRDFVLLEMAPRSRRQCALGRERGLRLSLGGALRSGSQQEIGAGARAVRRTRA